MQILDILARVQDEAPFDILDGRFAYWRGFSGRRYLHTVYALEALDGLDGGVAILTSADERALHVCLVEEGVVAFARTHGAVAAHVHFSAPDDLQRACNDLRAALGSRLAAL